MAKGNGKGKGRVKNTLPQRKGITNTLNPEAASSTLSFDFSYPDWLKSISNKNFSNRLSDESQFARFIFEIIQKLFPTVQKNWDVIKTNQKKQFPHCHTVAKGKISYVEDIIKDIHGRALMDKDNDDTLTYWQLGITQSIRVIAVYNQNKNVMYPVFVDYHHLMHESVKYNQNDFDSYAFCPVCRYSKIPV